MVISDNFKKTWTKKFQVQMKTESESLEKQNYCFKEGVKNGINY